MKTKREVQQPARIVFRVSPKEKKEFRLLCLEASTDMQSVLRSYVASAIKKKQP